MAFIRTGNSGDYPLENNNEEIRANRQAVVEQYVIDINNKLYELCEFLNLDISDIKKIDKKNYQKRPFNDQQKKAIIDVIKMQEESENRIREEVMEAAGIKSDPLVEIRRETLESIAAKNAEIEKSRIDRMKILSGIAKEEINKSVGVAPPKTDWKRVDVSKDEKQKIIESIKANPKSNVFSKDFKWNPQDFLGAFLYLENNSGPFMVSVVTDKDELEKYSKIPEISEDISQICFGKFVLLSIYDITATSKDSKYIYMGLNYIGMSGSLEFSSLGSVNGKVANSQKRIAIEFMDEMKISYKPNHKDLTA